MSMSNRDFIEQARRVVFDFSGGDLSGTEVTMLDLCDRLEEADAKLAGAEKMLDKLRAEARKYYEIPKTTPRRSVGEAGCSFFEMARILGVNGQTAREGGDE